MASLRALAILLIFTVHRISGQGCPAGTFGSLCQYTCHCQNSASCDRNSGSCGALGCAEGWTGNDCQTVVAAGGMSSTTLIIVVIFIILLAVHATGAVIYCVWRQKLKSMSDFQDYVDLEMTSPNSQRRSKENGGVTHLDSRVTGDGEGASTLGREQPLHWKEQEAMQEEQHYMAMASGPPSEWTDRYDSDEDPDEREYHVLDESILGDTRSRGMAEGAVNPGYSPSELDQDEYEQPVPLKTSSFKSAGTDVNVSMSPGTTDAAAAMETSRADSGWGTDTLTSSNGESDYEPGQSDTLKQLYRAVDKKKKGGQRRKSSGALRPLPPPPDFPDPGDREGLPPPPPPPREGDVYVEPDQSDTPFDGDVESDAQSTYDTLERQRKISSPYSLLGKRE